MRTVGDRDVRPYDTGSGAASVRPRCYLAVRQEPGKPLELWVGVDDENYGGTVRPLPAP